MKDKPLQEKFKSKLRTADEAVRMIRSGQRVFMKKNKYNNISRLGCIHLVKLDKSLKKG
jgi:hypothetical protein